MTYEIRVKNLNHFALCSDGKFRHIGFHNPRRFGSEREAKEVLQKLNNDQCEIVECFDIPQGVSGGWKNCF